MTLDPSAIREDGTDEGAQGVVVKGLRSQLELQGRREPRGADEKRARCWDYHGFDVRDGDVEDQGRPARQHSRTKPRGQDEKRARAGTIAPSKTNHGEITLDRLRKTGGQDDRQERWGKRELRVGGRPQQV